MASSVFTDPKDLTLPEKAETSLLHVGILPKAKSILTEWGFGWGLPAHGNSYFDCGVWWWKGCLNVEGHVQQGLDEDRVGKISARSYQRTCFRAECPVCYESWAGREAGKIAWRLQHTKKDGVIIPRLGKPIHLVVSPPVEVWIRSTFESLRMASYRIAKENGFRGGSCIFHHLRQNKLTFQWYFSPHFHMIGFGWIHGTKEGFERHGWVVKNVGIRKNVSGTALYQLSHAGIHASKHTVTWFGELAYNNMDKPPPMPEKEDLCPSCGEPMKPLYYFGNLTLPEERGLFWFSPDGWVEKTTRYGGG